MKVCVAGPIATSDVAQYLACGGAGLPSGYGGAPLTATLIGELLAQGCEVIGVTVDYALGAAAMPVSAYGPGFAFHILPGRRHAWRFNGRQPGRAWDQFRHERLSLARTIRDAAPDIVHAHWTYEFALGALDSGVSHVITCHDSPGTVVKLTASPYRMLRYCMAREVLARARCVTAVSDYMAGAVRALTRVPVVVVPNALAPHVLTRGRVRAFPDGHRIAMVCNGWGRLKNPMPAMRAFAVFRKQLPQAKLHLYGADFGRGEKAMIWAERRGVAEGMVFRGLLPHRELIGELVSLDLLLHPALEESFGVVIAEAMALGLPVVAGRVSGAVPWVVGADANSKAACAVLTDVNDVCAIALAIQEAFDERYGARSANGYSRARQLFSANDVATAYLRVYQEALVMQNANDSLFKRTGSAKAWRLR